MTEQQIITAEHIKTAQCLGLHINELLQLMVDKGASDLHLKVPSPPVLRIQGELIVQDNLPPITPDDVQSVF